MNLTIGGETKALAEYLNEELKDLEYADSNGGYSNCKFYSFEIPTKTRSNPNPVTPYAVITPTQGYNKVVGNVHKSYVSLLIMILSTSPNPPDMETEEDCREINTHVILQLITAISQAIARSPVYGDRYCVDVNQGLSWELMETENFPEKIGLIKLEVATTGANFEYQENEITC